MEERGGEGGRRGGKGGPAAATDEHGQAATCGGADELAGCHHSCFCLLQGKLVEIRLWAAAGGGFGGAWSSVWKGRVGWKGGSGQISTGGLKRRRARR